MPPLLARGTNFVLVFHWATSSNTESLVRGFSNLKTGWHFGDGVPAKVENVRLAISLLRYGIQLGLTRHNAFPGISGEIQLSFYLPDESTIEVVVESDRTISVLHEAKNRAELSEVAGVSYGEAISELRRIAGETWNTRDYSVLYTMIPPERTTKAWPLETPQTEVVPRSLEWNAQNADQEAFVPIFGQSTRQRLAGIPQYSGSSKQKFFQ